MKGRKKMINLKNYSQVFGDVQERVSNGEIVLKEEGDVISATYNANILSTKTMKNEHMSFEISYNRATRELFADEAMKVFEEKKPSEFCKIRISNLGLLLLPVAEYICDTNPWAAKALEGIISIPMDGYLSNYMKTYANCILVARNINEVERRVKVNRSTFIENFGRVSFDELLKITDLKSMPPKCRDWLEMIELSKSQKDSLRVMFQTISEKEDGNNAVIAMEYISQAIRLQIRRNSWRGESAVIRVAKGVTALVAEHGYNSKKVLEYAVRQSFYNSEFDFPDEEINQLYDYVKLAAGAGLNYERFPSNVFKAHNIMVKNVKSLEISPEDEEAFIAISKENKKYETFFKDYCVIMPDKPRDIVEEGNALSHCVAGYVPMIAAQKTIVGFLRLKSAPDTSLYTIEINGNKVIQAKGQFDSDVPEEILDVIHNIEAKWKSL